MLSPSAGLRVYLGLGQTDMRKSIDGLSILVSEKLKEDPFSGHLFVFCNRRRTIVKVLYWDKNGFCLWHKRLEKHKFLWPEDESAVREISSRELGWLMEGLSLCQPDAHVNLSYTTIC
ncbi:MAG: IS66 family insertion sequence element accessory protein TnpB [Lentisphaerae bacterium]|nr:IS66 family insertion sequence element accessory protein TnpB [Desulfobacteraceae bacterium]MCP4102078.1 IS66 family insertion sequence element accessory protein TnpB [Lentisphaerota bacterium]